MRSYPKKLNTLKLLSIFTFLILFSLPIRPAFSGNTLSVDSIQGPAFTLYYDLISGMGSSYIWFTATSNSSMNTTISTNPFLVIGNLKGCEFDLEGNLFAQTAGGFSFDVFAVSLSRSNITLRSVSIPTGSTFVLVKEDIANVAIGHFSWPSPPQDEINVAAFEASVGTAKIGKKNQRILKIYNYSESQLPYPSSVNRTKIAKSNALSFNSSRGATAFTISEEEEMNYVYYYDLSVNAYGGVYVLADLDDAYIPSSVHPLEVYFEPPTGGTQPNPPYNTLMVYKGKAIAFNVSASNSSESTQPLIFKGFYIPDGAQFTNPPATKEGYASATFQWPVGANVEDGIYTAIFGAYLSSGSNLLFPTLLVVNIKVQVEPPAIGGDQTSFPFNGTVGGSNPASKILSVTNTGGGTLNWTASKTQNWLSLSPNSGSSTGPGNPNQMTVSVDISGLSQGTYNDTITISGAGASNTLTIPVSLSLTAPAIGLDKQSMSFSVIMGGSNPGSQILSVSNSGSGGTTLNWTAQASTSSGGSWLSITPSSGQCTGQGDPKSITVSATVGSLAPGTYSGTITLSDPNASNNPQTVQITLAILAPEIGLDKESFSFSGNAGGSNPASQTLYVWNSGPAVTTLNWTAQASTSSGGSWLSITSSSGQCTGQGDPKSITVSATLGKLEAGTYSGTITISSSGASNSPRTANVSFTVKASVTPPRIGMDPPDLIAFANTQVGSTPGPKGLQISNQGGGTLSWSVTSKPSWVNLSLSSGQLATGKTSSIAVSANTSGLSVGTYNGGITVSAPGASNTPMTVPVTLTMTGSSTAPPRIGMDPPDLIDLANTQLNPIPPAKGLQISNQGGGTLIWSVSSKPSWINLSLTSGQLAMGQTSSIAVTANTAGLSAANSPYSGGITVSAPGASNTPMTVPVTLTLVSTTPTIGVNPQSLPFTHYTLGSSPPSQTISVNNAGGGTLRWKASKIQSWLTISPTSGSSTGSSSPTTMTVSVNTNDPTVAGAGSYYDTITIEDNGSTNSEGGTSTAATKTVSVSLNVIDGAPPASCDPSVPHITEWVQGVHWGRTGTVVGQNDVSYCIVLPDGLPLVSNQSYLRPAVPPGTPYQISLSVVDSAGEFHGNSFYVTLRKPSGENIAEGQYQGGLTTLNTTSTPPGPYLVTVKIREFIPGTSSAGFILSFSTYPALLPGELH